MNTIPASGGDSLCVNFTFESKVLAISLTFESEVDDFFLSFV